MHAIKTQEGWKAVKKSGDEMVETTLPESGIDLLEELLDQEVKKAGKLPESATYYEFCVYHAVFRNGELVYRHGVYDWRKGRSEIHHQFKWQSQ